ncbi:MAG: RNB domain-containing ribonuclease, partial [Myxococcales bacterium]|nr:RNB domain-containing ribonuclease [Myxococcales bacterium]
MEPALRTVMGRVLGPARYTSLPSLHFGLGAPLYLHFTSPIRRYADLQVHRIVKRFLAGDRTMAPR